MRTAIILALVGLVAVVSDADPAPKKRQPGALVLVIDRSGSMQGPKLETAKEAALAAIDALDPNDQVAVVVFDSEASVWIPLQRAANRAEIAKKLAKVLSGGGTNYLPGLQDAFNVLRDSKLKPKHVIFFSDGEAPSDGIVDVLHDMLAKGITTSAVGVHGADRDLLSMMADAGNGRLYMVQDLTVLPKVFAKEVKTALP